MFMAENEMPIINNAFRIKFKKEAGKTNSAIMTYIVPIVESNNLENQ